MSIDLWRSLHRPNLNRPQVDTATTWKLEKIFRGISGRWSTNGARIKASRADIRFMTRSPKTAAT